MRRQTTIMTTLIEILELMYLQAAKSNHTLKKCLKKLKKDKQVANRLNPCNFLTWEVGLKQLQGSKKSNYPNRRDLAKVLLKERNMNAVGLSQVLHQCHPLQLATLTEIDKHSISKFLRIENFFDAHRQDKHLLFKAWHPRSMAAVYRLWCALVIKERLVVKSYQICRVNINRQRLLSIGYHRRNLVHLRWEKRCHQDLINQVLRAYSLRHYQVIARISLIKVNLMASHRQVSLRRANWLEWHLLRIPQVVLTLLEAAKLIIINTTWMHSHKRKLIDHRTKRANLTKQIL